VTPFSRTLIALCVVGAPLMLTADPLSAATSGTTADGLTWDVVGGGVRITDCLLGGACSTGRLVIPETIDGKPVTVLGAGALNYLANLTEVILPSTLTTIGDGAFTYSGLLSITIPASVSTLGAAIFDMATDLTRVDFESPSALRNLGQWTFQNATGLRSLTLPEGLEAIDDSIAGTFAGLHDLTEINLPSTLRIIGNKAFAGVPITSISIPAAVERIGENAFYESSVEHIYFPASSVLTTIGDSAFAYTHLSSITIPATVTTLGSAIFRWSTTTHVAFESPSALRTLPSTTFQHAIEVQSVTLPEGLTAIGANAFDDLTDLLDPSDVSGNLVHVSLPSTLTTVGVAAFGDLAPGAHIDFPGNYPALGSTVWIGVKPNPTARVRFQPNTIGWPNPPADVGGFATERYLAAPRAPVATAGIHSASIEVSSNPTGPAWARVTITASPGGTTCVVIGASGRCTINDLQVGTSYTFTAVATVDSPALVSAASAPSVAVAPLAPVPTTTTIAPPVMTGGDTAPSDLPQTGREPWLLFAGFISAGVGLLILRAAVSRREQVA
jgi:BspA type Leucine rich repeat region (6 copies)